MFRIWPTLLFAALLPTLLSATGNGSSGASAAEIAVLDRDALRLGGEDGPDTVYRCHFRLSGTIENGDLEKLERLQGDEFGGYILCLDSPGGSFAEAVRFIKYFQQTRHGTMIEAGSRCESACALIFMGGVYHAFEVGEYAWRRMHPTARLGFHSPDLLVTEGAYSAATVNKAYRLALQSVSDTIETLVLKRDFDGQPFFRESLLAAMLATPPDEMMYVDTVDKAGRWLIEIHPDIEAGALDEAVLKQACFNAMAWVRDESALAQEHRQAQNLYVTKSRDEPRKETVWELSDGGMWERGCKIRAGVGTDGQRESVRTLKVHNDIGEEGSSGTDNYLFLPPSTRLASLGSAGTSVQASGSASAATAPAGTGTCQVFDGNGAKIDDEPCTRSTENQGRKTVTSYLWPSGGRTVIVKTGSQFSINGVATRLESPAAGGEGECAFNRQTGKRFCYSTGR